MSAKILVVDPSLLDRKRMTTILHAAGHQTLEFDAAAAVRAAVSAAPAGLPVGSIKLVLTEWDVPGEDSLAWVGWLHEVLPGVPVIVVTPQPGRDIIVSAVQHGVATIVAKPFGGDMLLRRVTETLEEAQVVRQGEAGQVSWQVQDYLRRELKRAGRSGRAVSVIIIAVGDAQAENSAIAAVARVMRESDLVSRLDSGRVIVILPETDQVGVSVVEAKIWQVLADLMQTEPDRPALSFVFETGSATFPEDSLEEDGLIGSAAARLHTPTDERRRPV